MIELTFPEEEVNAIFEELAELAVPLDTDPISFGPKRLNQKTAEVRKMLDRVHRIYLDMAQRHGAAKRMQRRLEAQLDLDKKSLMSNDPDTRAARNLQMQEAIVTVKLQPQVEELNEIEILVGDLEAVLVVIKAKHSDLKDTEGRLRDQVRLCSEELSLGGKWSSIGGNNSTTSSVNLNRATGADVKAIDELLAGMDREIDLAQYAGNFPATHMKITDPVLFSPVPTESIPESTESVSESTETEIPPEEATEEFLESVTVVDLQVAMPAQTNQKNVEDFLSEVIAPMHSNPLVHKEVITKMDTSDIDDLLFSFENPNG